MYSAKAGDSAVRAQLNGAPACTRESCINNPQLPWGLNRISNGDTVVNEYNDGGLTGSQVRVYVVDSGVQATHKEFLDDQSKSRVAEGFSGLARPDCSNCLHDKGRLPAHGVGCNYHGTHVASTVAGNRFGVAKRATIVPVSACPVPCKDGRLACLDGASIREGLNWVLKDLRNQPNGTRGVIQRSLSGSYLDIDKQLLASGVPVVATAGNTRDDVCRDDKYRRYDPVETAAKILVGAVGVGTLSSGIIIPYTLPGSALCPRTGGSQNLCSTDAAPYPSGHLQCSSYDRMSLPLCRFVWKRQRKQYNIPQRPYPWKRAQNFLATFSGYGHCVTLLAPGVNILGADVGPTNDAVKASDGTSMAAPHVSGAVAQVRSTEGRPLWPSLIHWIASY